MTGDRRRTSGDVQRARTAGLDSAVSTVSIDEHDVDEHGVETSLAG